MYSALKKDGVPLYKLARKGEVVSQEARDVVVHDIKLVDFSGNKAKIYVHCGRGTYIRTIVNDLGEKLGCLASMSALERTSYGPYKIEDAVTLDELAENPGKYIEKTETVFEGAPKLTLNEINLKRYLDGKTVTLKYDGLDAEESEMLLFTPEGRFFATCGWEKNATDGRITLIRGRFFGL